MARFTVALGCLLAGLLTMTSAEARRIDFDAVCIAVPCLIDIQYQSLGLTFDPPSVYSIVGAGTSGLTGTNGGKFVLIGSPNNLLMRNTRESTFVTFDVASVTGASGDLALNIYPTRSGAPAGPPQFRTLGGVNQWHPVVVSEPGGFDGVRIQATGTGNLSSGLDNVYWGGSCAQFTDISQTYPELCEAVEALYQRGITLGATPTTYNAGDPTTRGAMALFLWRLLQSQQPETRYFSSSHSNVNITTPLACAQTGSLTFDTSKRLSFEAEVVVRNASPGTNVSVAIEHSPNGTLWSPVPPGWTGETTLLGASRACRSRRFARRRPNWHGPKPHPCLPGSSCRGAGRRASTAG